ncbi:MAG: PQQ-dependent sugar dehydrogenase [Gemmataceae bacterium]|nr:PQQ-dependent sugar dehydrogenase [Gemmataceae bacterium]
MRALTLAAALAVPAAAAAQPVLKPHGLEAREPWTASNVKGSPEPPGPYQLVRTYPKLAFNEALELAPVPGKAAWVVAERPGTVYTFAADAPAPEKKLILDVKHTIYGVVLHPNFAANGYLYLSEVPDGSKETPDGTRVVRYTVDRATMTADPKSAKVIFTWPNGGHNGGCLRFGPDGMLYISTGDGSGIADGLQTGQDLGTVLGKILRIDVNRIEESAGYSVPPDNPFANTAGARGEVWAYGIRQCWKISFDTATGDLWAGEVGQDLWEMVYRIEKGGNYGWSVQEGAHPFRPERKRGPTPILAPVVEHNHAEFRSLTGGYVYHGKKLPELDGAYVYGDYDTGRVWMLKYDRQAKRVTEHRELCDTTLRIVAWAQDAAGEVYALNFIDGGIYHLAPNPPAKDAPPFPRKLSQTGLFASTKEHTPAKGLIPYSVNAELWSDGASKQRFLAIPGLAKIEYETVTYPQPAPGSQPGWRFPDGTVLVKTFTLPTEPGKARRLETRLLVAERVGGTEEYGDQVWNGYTYIWADDQTDAELADARGVDREFTVRTAAGNRVQKWHFPSRAECTMCHTVTAKYALGVNTAQMNKVHLYNNSIFANQLATLEHIGVFDRKLPAVPEKLAKLADYRDKNADLDSRAWSYLHANCSHCHRKWGGGNAEFQLLATLPLPELGIINTKPGQGNFDLRDPRILVPGDPDRSMLYHRMTRTGLGRMPHIASAVVDDDGVALIRDWIKAMK